METADEIERRIETHQSNGMKLTKRQQDILRKIFNMSEEEVNDVPQKIGSFILGELAQTLGSLCDSQMGEPERTHFTIIFLAELKALLTDFRKVCDSFYE